MNNFSNAADLLQQCNFRLPVITDLKKFANFQNEKWQRLISHSDLAAVLTKPVYEWDRYVNSQNEIWRQLTKPAFSLATGTNKIVAAITNANQSIRLVGDATIVRSSSIVRWSSYRTVEKNLPNRGWYTTRSCISPDVVIELSKYIEAKDWEMVDSIMLDNLPTELLVSWIDDKKVPDWCLHRLSLFVENHRLGNYEEATYIGMPLIDELCRNLYDNRDFTSSRGKKPHVMIRGSADTKKSSDENYLNRNALLHGLSKRNMGIKDSAKCLTTICFIIFAVDECGALLEHC